MGCICCSLSSFTSIVLDALERISLCTVCAMLTCCLMFTIMIVMILGIGIGFHYCSVQNSVEAMAKAAEAAGAMRQGEQNRRSGLPAGLMRSVDKAVKRGFAHRLQRREAVTLPEPNKPDTHPETNKAETPPVSNYKADVDFRKTFFNSIANMTGFGYQ